MGKSAAIHRLPDTLVLLAHPDILPWLSKFFSRIDFAQFTVTTQPFTVRTMLPNNAPGDASQTAQGSAEDPGLALAVGFVTIEQNEA